jgi:hypothetical protein
MVDFWAVSLRASRPGATQAAPAWSRMARAVWAMLVFGASWGTWGVCHADAMRLCDRSSPLSAEQQDKVFRFGGIIKAELEKSGQSIVLIARSGLDLSRFGFRYSHAGVSFKAGRSTPWSVRQLYYACDEQRPRIYDQGMSGFLLGSDAPSIGYVSVVFFPSAEAAALERVASDDRRAMRLLGPAYSANAFPFSARYQNCNQWVLELVATAWGHLDDTGGAEEQRTQSQGWLQGMGYVPSVFDVRYLMWLGALIPWLHSDDHPPEDIEQSVYRVSMPASIEAFVHATVSGASRIEFCRTERHIVIRRGWDPIPEGCQPDALDTVIALE